MILFEQELNESLFNNNDLTDVEKKIKNLQDNLIRFYDKKNTISSKNFFNKPNSSFKETIYEPHNYKLWTQIEADLGKIFNARILMDYSALHPNAVTVLNLFNPIDLIKGGNSYLLHDNGYKFSDHTTVIMSIDLNLLKILNERETLSIILHEIGHNFYRFNFFSRIVLMLTYFIRLLAYGYYFLSRLTTHINMTILRIFNEAISKFLKLVNKIYNNVLSSVADLSVAINEFTSIFDLLNSDSFFSKLGLLPENFVKLFLLENYSQESFADNFVASYGYGKDLATAVVKLNEGYRLAYSSETTKRHVNDPNFSGQFVAIYNTFDNVVAKLTDAHPGSVQRIKNIHEYLDTQIKTNKITDKRILEQAKKDADYLHKVTTSKNDIELKKLGIALDDSMLDFLKEKVFKPLGNVDPDKSSTLVNPKI